MFPGKSILLCNFSCVGQLHVNICALCNDYNAWKLVLPYVHTISVVFHSYCQVSETGYSDTSTLLDACISISTSIHDWLQDYKDCNRTKHLTLILFIKNGCFIVGNDIRKIKWFKNQVIINLSWEIIIVFQQFLGFVIMIDIKIQKINSYFPYKEISLLNHQDQGT